VEQKFIIKVPGPGRVELEVDPSDQDTPVMVLAMGRKLSSTYTCAMDTGCVEDHELTQAQLDFLGGFEQKLGGL
jgi:hypothetical protein